MEQEGMEGTMRVEGVVDGQGITPGMAKMGQGRRWWSWDELRFRCGLAAEADRCHRRPLSTTRVTGGLGGQGGAGGAGGSGVHRGDGAGGHGGRAAMAALAWQWSNGGLVVTVDWWVR